MDDLLREFVGETLDMMDAVAGDLVAWEADPADRSGLDGIFRMVHTVKGSSGFFDLPRISAIAHAAEELLDVLRSRKGVPSRANVAMVLVAFDKIRELTLAISSAGHEPAGEDSRLIRALLADIRSTSRRTSTADTQAMVAEIVADQLLQDGTPDDAASLTEEMPQAWRSVRVPLALLDDVMSGVSDLVLARNEVASQMRARGFDPADFGAFERLSQLLVAVRTTVSSMRMVPLRHLYAPLPRLVRQVADELGKDVQLLLEGSEVEIDREVVEALRDPMLHILRNAIDHGLENKELRLAQGKPAQGQLIVKARQAGNRIWISISDDGAGLDVTELVARAIKAGHLTDADAAALDEEGKAELVFLPGLSTAQHVTGISGRGVGMDVVRANIERLGGVIRITNVAGQGVSLTLDVPMTLTIISALAVDTGTQSFAIPRSAIDEVMLASSDMVQRQHNSVAGLVKIREKILSLLRLETVLGMPEGAEEDEADRALIICRHGNAGTFALDVPDVRDHEELVIKPLPPVLLGVGLYSGLSLPDNGQPMLVLDVEGIARRHVKSTGHSASAVEQQCAEPVVDGRSSWLTYREDMEQCWRAVPMAHVERICDIETADIHMAGGRILARVDQQAIAVAAVRLDDISTPRRRMIRLSDGCRTVMVPAFCIGDMMDLKPDLAPADAECDLIGMTLVDGQLIELVDTYAVLARFGGTLAGPQESEVVPDPSAKGGASHLWIVDPAGGEWAANFMIPTLTAAGYLVSIVRDMGKTGSASDAVITLTGDGPRAPVTLEVGGNIHQFSAYDRDSLMRILSSAAATPLQPAKRTGGEAVR